jgi:hypothetical protein
MLVSLGATKVMAQRLMTKFPDHRTACQFIVDFAKDGEGDMGGAIDLGAGAARQHENHDLLHVRNDDR